MIGRSYRVELSISYTIARLLIVVYMLHTQIATTLSECKNGAGGTAEFRENSNGKIGAEWRPDGAPKDQEGQ